MEHALILLIQLIGISLNVLQKVYELDKLSPDDSFEEVLVMFWKTDRVTVIISGVITLAYGLFYFITLDYAPASIVDHPYFDLIFFGCAFVIGYAGQQLVYKALGKAVDIAKKKIEDTKG